MDERFDGIVYSVAFLGGATCVIHLHNLPGVVAASQYQDALASGAAPDLRDLLILTTSPELSTELGRGCVVILAAVFIGAVIGAFQLGGRTLLQTAVGECCDGRCRSRHRSGDGWFVDHAGGDGRCRVWGRSRLQTAVRLQGPTGASGTGCSGPGGQDGPGGLWRSASGDGPAPNHRRGTCGPGIIG